jgi:integrase
MQNVLQNVLFKGDSAMARPRLIVPSYRKHSKTGRAVVTIHKADGTRSEVLLPGSYGSEISKQEYERLLSQLRANEGKLPAKLAPSDLTIAELVKRFMAEFVEVQYRHADGTATREQANFIDSLRPLVRLFANKPVSEFTSLNLRAYRDALIAGSWRTPKEQSALQKSRGQDGTVCRAVANQRVSRIKRLFRWGTEMMLLSPDVWHGVQSVAGLHRGRSSARETMPVLAVDPETVDATLPYLPPTVADMVRVQLLTGMRPGELCAMRGVDIDVTTPVWIYKPARHKTQHAGHLRHIAIGPQAQFILRRYWKTDADAFLFSPAEQAEILKLAKRKKRKSKVQPSQIRRTKANAQRKPGNHFSVKGYCIAVRRASKKAGVLQWHPHQLRHTAALLIERRHGAEAARATLGHRTLQMTLFYSGIDTQRASEVAAKMG